MYILIAMFSALIAAMGVGGGSIFILLSTIFNVLELREAQAYNLIMFIIVGMFATISNFKNKAIDKNLLKKLIIPVCFGSLAGIYLVKYIDKNILINIFYAFMLLIGFYEIISSLKSIKNAKNKSRKELS
ncbi:MAG: sulfite exporter TauE/SafE family protein [Clostridia bacterium]